MPTLNISGQRVKVGDEFLSLTPDQQNAAVDEISKSLPAASKPYSGTILPLSRDAQGNVSFDSNAGIFGMAKRAFEGIGGAVTLPGDVYTGKTSITGPDGHTNPEVINRAADLASLVTPVNPAVRAGDRAIPGVAKTLVREKPKIPTTEELAAAGGAGINAAKNSGLELNSAALSNYSKDLQQGLFDGSMFGKTIHPVDAPATFAKLKEIENAPPGSLVTAANLQSLRESLQATAQNFNPAAAKDQLAASLAIKRLDDLLPNVAQKDVLAGAPAATQKLFETGRGNYASAMRSNDITGVLDRANTGILERAETRAQAANSGRNIDNTIRSKVASVLEKPKEISGLSGQELAALNQVVEGGSGRNAARYIANLMGGGGGAAQSLMTAIGAAGGANAGGIPGALVGAALPASVGSGAKAVANAIAKRDLRKVDELMRKRSPLYEERLANAPLVAEGLGKRAAIARLLMQLRDRPQQ